MFIKPDCTYIFSIKGERKRNKFLSILLLLSPIIIMIPLSSLLIAMTYSRENNQMPSTLCKADSSKTFTISGRVTQTYSYCGGAAPPQELLEKLAKPVILAGKKFYIRKGKINSCKNKVIMSFTTGKDGEFSIRLAPGTYAIILEEQLHTIKVSDYAKPDQQVDEKCLLEWWRKPYFVLEIKDRNINQLNFNFYRRCFITSDIPCITYEGPQPS